MGTEGHHCRPIMLSALGGCVPERVHRLTPLPLLSPTLCGLQVLQKVAAEKKGQVQVFCGSPALAKVLKGPCEQFGFKFFQENF